MVAPRQLWEAKENRSTFDQRVIATILDIEIIKILDFLTPRHEH
jgi:hypothetical protein